MSTANDSILVTPGSGATVATELIAAKEYQVVIIADDSGHLLASKPTYSYIVPSSAVGANKVWLDIFNAAGSGNVMNVLSVRPIIDTDVAVVGALGIRLLLFRTSTVGTGGTAHTYKSATLDVAGGTITPQDTANAALPAQITARHLPTGGSTVTEWLRGCYVMGEEASTSMAYQFQGQFNMLDLDGDAGQHLTLREGEGIVIKQGAVAATGNVRFRVTFTLE